MGDSAAHLRGAFEQLVAEADARPVVGWDFSWLGDRIEETALPWDFDSEVSAAALHSPDLLDLGTGGGEWLASLRYRPDRTVATEAWEPNVPVARDRLAPLGVEVVQVEAAPDNPVQQPDEGRGRLPFPSTSFHLVVSRHESYVAGEIRRVLARDGRFLTEQLSPGSADFAQLLDMPPPNAPRFRLELAAGQLEDAGLEVSDSQEGEQVVHFADVGALAWYLKAVPWAVPDFTPRSFKSQLRRLHETRARLEARLYAFRLEARPR